MNSFFDNPNNNNLLFDESDLNLELIHLLQSTYANKDLQEIFNQYLNGIKSFAFIETLSKNLDKIHDGDLLYQAYKITRHQNVPDQQPYLDLLLRASNLGSFHARHELALTILTQNVILTDKTWIVWSLEHLRSALENYYDFPNNLYNIKIFIRDLLYINTFLQSVLEKKDFYIDKLAEQTNPEYDQLITRLLEQKNGNEFLVNLPKPKGYTLDIRLRALVQQKPLYVGDSYEQLMEESLLMTTSEQHQFNQLLKELNIQPQGEPLQQTNYKL
jgi:homospermidine synthase